jgi:hypothetical protein
MHPVGRHVDGVYGLSRSVVAGIEPGRSFVGWSNDRVDGRQVGLAEARLTWCHATYSS